MGILKKIFSGRFKFGSAKYSELADIKNVLNFSVRGVYKRIDENRELLELLQNKNPDFLREHFWIEGWLGCQDIFLVNLAQFVPSDDQRVKEGRYPRPWPGKRPLDYS